MEAISIRPREMAAPAIDQNMPRAPAAGQGEFSIRLNNGLKKYGQQVSAIFLMFNVYGPENL